MIFIFAKQPTPRQLGQSHEMLSGSASISLLLHWALQMQFKQKKVKTVGEEGEFSLTRPI